VNDHDDHDSKSKEAFMRSSADVELPGREIISRTTSNLLWFPHDQGYPVLDRSDSSSVTLISHHNIYIHAHSLFGRAAISIFLGRRHYNISI